MPYGAPHPPLQEEPDLIDAYKLVFGSESRRLYAAATTRMDSAIGRLISAVDQSGQRENTLVVFFSDNGAIEHWPVQTKNYNGRFGPYPALGDNGHLRGWIGDLYDSCVRTPALLNWPGVLKPRVTNNTVSALDLYPTLAALANAPPPESLKLEGRDIWPPVSKGDSVSPAGIFVTKWLLIKPRTGLAGSSLHVKLRENRPWRDEPASPFSANTIRGKTSRFSPEVTAESFLRRDFQKSTVPSELKRTPSQPVAAEVTRLNFQTLTT